MGSEMCIRDSSEMNDEIGYVKKHPQLFDSIIINHYDNQTIEEFQNTIRGFLQ